MRNCSAFRKAENESSGIASRPSLVRCRRCSSWCSPALAARACSFPPARRSVPLGSLSPALTPPLVSLLASGPLAPMSSSSSASSALASSSLKDLLKICRSHSILLPEVLPKDKHYYIDLILRHRAEAGRLADDPFAEAGKGNPFAGETGRGNPFADAGEEAEGGFSGTIEGAEVGAGGSGDAREDADWGASQSSLAALRASSASFGNDDDFVEVSHRAATAAAAAPSAPEQQEHDDAPLADRHVQVRHRGSKSSAAGAAAPPVFAFNAASSAEGASSATLPALSASASYAAAAASVPPQPSAPLNDRGLSPGEAALAAHDVVYDDEDEEFTRTPAVQRITSILADIALFDWLESRTGVKRFYCFMLGVTLACAGILTYIGPLAVANFICFVYPAYQTYKTLEGKYLPESMRGQYLQESVGVGAGNEDEGSVSSDASVEVHRYWLTYWCVYGLFKLVEFLADVVLAPWVPYYEPAKVAFLVWSFHPSSQGCALVYAWVIRPAFLPREESIDRAIDRLLDSTQQAGREVKAIILKKVAKRIAGEDGAETPNKDRANRGRAL